MESNEPPPDPDKPMTRAEFDAAWKEAQDRASTNNAIICGVLLLGAFLFGALRGLILGY